VSWFQNVGVDFCSQRMDCVGNPKDPYWDILYYYPERVIEIEKLPLPYKS